MCSSALCATMPAMSKSVKLIVAGILAVVLAGGAFLLWFFQDDAPDEVDLGAAVESVEDDAAADPTTEATDAPADAGVEGTWAVDGDSGTFDFTDTASGTFVGFRVNEELSSIGSATAVGRTPEVIGEITIDGTELTAATFEADMTAITTNESRRDTRVHSALDTTQFPTATFVLTEPVDLGAAAESGEPVSVTATGELTIKGITQSVEIPLEAQLTGDTIVVVGSMDIVFADYGVAVPAAPVVLSADDHGVLEVQLLLARA
jgi:polyisoprenoid-binding protein YceI